ncbi:hypothetical protein ACLQ28_33045 [Micromonospora sp. DT201]|uniref:hypothetical protein n=1 Tax=Micromonospora sp. DT201 TaxID=3393442 RepID=UPI003CEF1765
MGNRAVVTITDQHGNSRSFWAGWGSPDYQIPHLADFVAWADRHQRPLTVDNWLAHADTFPGTLPRLEVTGTTAAHDTYIGDLDYRYQLVLHDDSHAVRLRVQQLRGPMGQPQPHLVADLTHATLYGEAARLCELMADRAQQWADSHGGTAPPGNDPDGWRRRAAQFHEIHQSTPVVAIGANLDARLVAASFDAPHPAIHLAGVWVFAYVDAAGVLQLSARLQDAAGWLRRPDGTVPMRVTVDGEPVFDA